jgi:hypothetical protein
MDKDSILTDIIEGLTEAAQALTEYKGVGDDDWNRLEVKVGEALYYARKIKAREQNG